MRIGYFAPMSGRQAGGPETYDRKLAAALALSASEHTYTVYGVTPAAQPLFAADAPQFGFRLLRPRNRILSFTLGLPIELMRRPVDVLHATYIAPPWTPAPMVLTVHDLSPFSHPHFYPAAIRARLQLLLSVGIRRAALILASSQFTRECIVKQFPGAKTRTIALPLGVDERFRVLADQAMVHDRLAALHIRRPYVLYVGKLQARKNVRRMLVAFARAVCDHRLPHALVLAGRRIWDTREIFDELRSQDLESRVICTGHIEDADLPILYNGAAAFLYPSLFEGFGLPVLEAMACGAPVVSSTTTSIPEVAGDAAVLADPESVDEIAAGLHAVLTDTALADRLRRAGFARAQQFTWQRTAAGTLEAYRRAAEPSDVRAVRPARGY